MTDVINERKKNTVHMDENWRQRVRSEEQAALSFKGNWGYLECEKPDSDINQHTVTMEELGHTLARNGPCFNYIQDRHVERSLAREAGATIMGSPSSRSGSQSSRGSRRSRGSNPTSPMNQTKSYTDSFRFDVVPENPPMYLDAESSFSLQPQSLQSVGTAVFTEGVDPRLKYKTPLTSSQNIGWRSHQSLEFFGVSEHGTRNMDINRLYGSRQGVNL